jgi:hypothetical protein
LEHLLCLTASTLHLADGCCNFDEYLHWQSTRLLGLFNNWVSFTTNPFDRSDLMCRQS